jgi:hypothetical protein
MGLDTPHIPSAEEINNMTEVQHKVLENWLRRAPERQGLRLEKPRRRDPRALDYGTDRLVSNWTGGVVAGDTDNGYGAGLDDVARCLWGYDR